MIIAAMIIFVGLVLHACVNHYTLMKMRQMDQDCREHLQHEHHKHEMEFAKKQAELFRVEKKS